jgi:polysaccharide export outer membrane protein
MLWMLAGILTGMPCAAQEPLDKGQGHSTYALGAGDQVSVSVLDLDEMGKQPYRLDMHGNLTLPVVGRLAAGGLTVEQLEDAIRQGLSKYLKDPDVTVSVMEMRSQPVSVLGEVRNPGIVQLMGRKTLYEVLSTAGGLNPDAGYSIRITRQAQWGRIPLPDAKLDESGEFWVAEVGVKDVMDGVSPEKNIEVKPNDVITVPKGSIVYVLGAVTKSGGFVLGQSQTVTVLQALALAEGLDRFANSAHARILRKTNDPNKRLEIAVNLNNVLSGKAQDISLESEDILSIPVSGTKRALARAGEAIAQASGAAVWRPY